jgi:hypothetical protein
MIRARAALCSAVLGFGLLVGFSPSAAAADIGTVTVNYDGSLWSITPSSLSGSVGDTFVLINERNSDDNLSSTFVSLQNDSGSVSAAGVSCTASGSCPVLDKFLPPKNSMTFTIDSFGTLKVMRSLRGVVTQVGTLTIGGSEVFSSVPASMTLNFNANGGTCTGVEVVNAPIGSAYTTPTQGVNGGQCNRDGFTLMGWGRTPSSTSAVVAAGGTANIADNGTLYAIWFPGEVALITYNANVGLDRECLSDGINMTTAESRQSAPVVVEIGALTAANAPCAPEGVVLIGWALSGNGQPALGAGNARIDWLTPGSSQTLYAQWKVTYDLTLTVPTLIVPNGSMVVVQIEATVNGAPASGQIVAIETAGIAQLAGGTTSANVQMDAAGKARIEVYAKGSGVGLIGAAFGDQPRSGIIYTQKKYSELFEIEDSQRI